MSAYLALDGFTGAAQIFEGPQGMAAGMSSDADTACLQTDTARSRRFGFGAKLCIPTAQLATVSEMFAPTSDQKLQFEVRGNARSI